jgi:putative transcriptional regulator
MARKRAFRSDAHAAIHDAATALHRVGVIDKATMRDFDTLSLAAPPPLSPDDIRRIREQARVSQPVFARYLNTSESTVEKWETGAKKPSGMALKLLAVVQKRGIDVLN